MDGEYSQVTSSESSTPDTSRESGLWNEHGAVESVTKSFPCYLSVCFHIRSIRPFEALFLKAMLHHMHSPIRNH